MLFDKTTTEQTVRTLRDSAVGTAFLFDWEKNCFAMADGSPVELTGEKAVRAWLQLVVRTAAGRLRIYPADFGARAQDLVGRKIPQGAGLSELRRQIADSARHLPVIQEVSKVTYEGGAIHCTVTLANLTQPITEVIDLGT